MESEIKELIYYIDNNIVAMESPEVEKFTKFLEESFIITKKER